MRGLEDFTKVHLYRESVDMRKSINGLSMLVMDELGMSFEVNAMFVFVSRCGKKLKLLYWDRSGFALWYKRLEKAKFYWPRDNENDNENEIVDVEAQQLQNLLLGFDVFQKPHKYLQYNQIW